METIEHSISALTDHFNMRMAEFQQALQVSPTAASPSSAITVQFEAFRQFVMTSLENLQMQVQVLSKQVDNIEMRSRRKMLLLHGIPEVSKESVSSVVLQALTEHLDLPGFTVTNLSFSKRLGQPKDEKPRPILIKFCDVSLRNKIWFQKTQFKGSGVTLSEYLTKERHRVFLTARQMLGVSRCWTKNGQITVLGDNGKHHSIHSVDDIKRIVSQFNSTTVPVSGSSVVAASISVSTPSKACHSSPIIIQSNNAASPRDAGVLGQRSVRSCTNKAKNNKK